jgi:predicted DNA-binding ribbon-helix-helix protein
MVCAATSSILLPTMSRSQSPCKRNTQIDGHKSSVSVEPEFWDQLRLAAWERQTTLTNLLVEINRTGRLLPPQGPNQHRVRNLSAAVRVFVLNEVLAKLAQAQEPATQTPSEGHHSGPSTVPEQRSAPSSPWRAIGERILGS